MWSKALKSEDLRRIIETKKVIFKLQSFAHEVKIPKYFFKISLLVFLSEVKITILSRFSGTGCNLTTKVNQFLL